MRSRVVLLCAPLVLAACSGSAYLKADAFVKVTARQAASAVRAGTLDVETAKKLSDALKVADAALDAYAVAWGETDAPDRRARLEATWSAVDAALASVAAILSEGSR